MLHMLATGSKPRGQSFDLRKIVIGWSTPHSGPSTLKDVRMCGCFVFSGWPVIGSKCHLRFQFTSTFRQRDSKRDVLRLQFLNHGPALCPDVLLANRTQKLSVLQHLPVCRNTKRNIKNCYQHERKVHTHTQKIKTLTST